MLTIKITKLFKRLSVVGSNTGRFYSASQAELGEDAGSITWENCRRDGTARLRDLTDAHTGWDDLHDQIREYAKSFGAWDEKDIDTWSQTDLHAFLLQDIAAAVREWDSLDGTDDGWDGDWKEYQAECEKGSMSGRLSLGDNGSDVYYSIYS